MSKSRSGADSAENCGIFERACWSSASRLKVYASLASRQPQPIFQYCVPSFDLLRGSCPLPSCELWRGVAVADEIVAEAFQDGFDSTEGKQSGVGGVDMFADWVHIRPTPFMATTCLDHHYASSSGSESLSREVDWYNTGCHQSEGESIAESIVEAKIASAKAGAE